MVKLENASGVDSLITLGMLRVKASETENNNVHQVLSRSFKNKNKSINIPKPESADSKGIALITLPVNTLRTLTAPLYRGLIL